MRINETLTFLFEDQLSFQSHHYAFHVTDTEFGTILQRVQEAGLSYGSAPWSLDDGMLNSRNGGRRIYFRTPDGHVLEMMTGQL